MPPNMRNNVDGQDSPSTMLAILNYNKPSVLRNTLRTLVGHCKKIHTLLLHMENAIVQMIDGDTAYMTSRRDKVNRNSLETSDQHELAIVLNEKGGSKS